MPVVIRTDLGCWVKVNLPDDWVRLRPIGDTSLKSRTWSNLVEEKVRPRTHTLTSLWLILSLW